MQKTFFCSLFAQIFWLEKERTRRFYLRSIHKALFDPKIVISPDYSMFPNSISRNRDILVEIIFRHFFTKTHRIFPIYPRAVFLLFFCGSECLFTLSWCEIHLPLVYQSNAWCRLTWFSIGSMSLAVNAWLYLNGVMGQIGPYQTLEETGSNHIAGCY